ncbi:MAG: hypothetical protein JXR76_05435 [Deltaproteobacteria bacterium]|nr:hypothetical protein [Deltaproteobacteria bacterium]
MWKCLPIALLFLTACVADKIEFHETLNSTPELVLVLPPNETVQVVTEPGEHFTVVVWDRDVRDTSLYAAFVTVIHTNNAGVITADESNLCDQPTFEVADSELYDEGVLVTIECTASYILESVPKETTVMVEVDISDRGFGDSREDVSPGARHLKVSWGRELYPRNN